MPATIDKASFTSSITSQELSTSPSEERAPRFTSAALAGGRVHTAKNHSFSMPAETFVRMNSEDPSQSVPGAYVEGHQVKSDTVSDEHLSHAGHDHRPRFKVDLPTHEEPSGSRQGVGSLPGPMNAEYVAMLPDERMHMHDVEIHEAELHRKAHRAKGSKREPKHKNFATQPSSQLPTTERPSGSNIGIGSMPGKNRESGVATLPEERIEGRPYGQGHTGFESSLDTGWKVQHHHHINRCPVSYALLGISFDEEKTSKDITAQGQPAFEWSHYLEPKAQPPPAVNRCPVDAALLGFDTDDAKSKDKGKVEEYE
ncbi:hypothetical protein BDN70DRAFT_568874 [Pholiota conissans]|uniref:Uncharacterized protein n=1 Tax=Pholiota conissans TaxID=109636 RepID=A0A9P5Z446_9AGAR|nr:hypothetical protein BDN70DRAFT_568874 [Pholiota conissans]